MLESLKNKAIDMALNSLKNSVLEQYLAGIGKIEEMRWKNGHFFIKLRLDGLEQAVECECCEIYIAQDASSISINKFQSNLVFVQTALNRFVAGKPFAMPGGKARLGLKAARRILGL